MNKSEIMGLVPPHQQLFHRNALKQVWSIKSKFKWPNPEICGKTTCGVDRGSGVESVNVPSRSSDCVSFLQFSTIVLAASIILSVNDDLSAFANICSTPDLEFSLFDEIFLTLICSPLRIPAGMQRRI